VTAILHVSDLHFGQPSVAAQIDAIEERIRAREFDVVVVSGDVSQRSRYGEFQRARAFLRDAARFAATLVVPGNHDVKWWRAPLGVGSRAGVTWHYRHLVSAELEPVLQVPGITFVGLNSAHGVMPYTLKWNPRHIGVMGDITRAQIEGARERFAAAPAGDARVLVFHHNPLRGQLSNRYGVAHPKRLAQAFADLSVDLVLCGHDHQEAVHHLPHGEHGTLVCTAGTLSDRSRGKRPPVAFRIDVDDAHIGVTPLVWGGERAAFVAGEERSFPR